MNYTNRYIHGYNDRELQRLKDQAVTLEELLHAGTFYPAGSRVLEAGCGVGSQTLALAKRSPDARITSVDISSDSIAEARTRLEKAGGGNVEFLQADIRNLPFQTESFDHVFVCFVLEHLPEPAKALGRLKTWLKPGGTITVIEGDHGSTFFHPENKSSIEAIDCLVELQRRACGNALIGRELYPLLCGAGFTSVEVSPRFVYADSSRPEMVDGFTKKTFAAMIGGIREAAIASGLMSADLFDEGVRGLYRAAEEDGVFCYTFFKAVAFK